MRGEGSGFWVKSSELGIMNEELGVRCGREKNRGWKPFQRPTSYLKPPEGKVDLVCLVHLVYPVRLV